MTSSNTGINICLESPTIPHLVNHRYTTTALLNAQPNIYCGVAPRGRSIERPLLINGYAYLAVINGYAYLAVSLLDYGSVASNS
jgi:hypothetical protein